MADIVWRPVLHRGHVAFRTTRPPWEPGTPVAFSPGEVRPGEPDADGDGYLLCGGCGGRMEDDDLVLGEADA